MFLYNLNFSNQNPKNIQSFLCNERIIIDPTDEEDGDVSIINFIIIQDQLITDIPVEIKEIIELYNKGELE